MEAFLRFVKALIPAQLFRALQPAYHRTLAAVGALWYRFPSREIHVVGVTGTKGKTTVTEMVYSILKEAGYRVALSNTIRFTIADETERNLHKMTMPGRLFVERFLRHTVQKKCDWAVLEMTSEGVKQFRHAHIDLDALIFTNLSPEHIESHGSFEKYRDAKRELGRLLEHSTKDHRTIVANVDDKEGVWYLGLGVEKSVPYALKNAEPFEKTDDGHVFTFDNTLINVYLPGVFNLYNALAAASFAQSIGVKTSAIKKGIEACTSVRGRVEFVQHEPFAVVVDYAHTIDSLEQFYEIFREQQNICILGNTGGGRDTWKRPKMAAVAEKYCSHIILTNEDPYDENPKKIVNEMARGVADMHKLEIIMNRREAIRHALSCAKPGDNVLITGKGTDPFIMGPHGSKEAWDDARVVREELEKMTRER